MIVGPKQTIFSGDISVAGGTLYPGVTGQSFVSATAGTTLITLPVRQTAGAVGIIFRLWQTGGVTAATITPSTNWWPSWTGAAGAAGTVLPGAGAGGVGSFEVVAVASVSASAAMTAYSTGPLGMIIRAYPVTTAVFMAPNLVPAFACSAVAIVALQIEAKVIYRDYIPQGLDINGIVPPAVW